MFIKEYLFCGLHYELNHLWQLCNRLLAKMLECKLGPWRLFRIKCPLAYRKKEN